MEIQIRYSFVSPILQLVPFTHYFFHFYAIVSRSVPGIFFHWYLFSWCFNASSQCLGGPRAVKVVIVINFPILQAGQTRCCKGFLSGRSTVPKTSCSHGINFFLW